MFSRLLASNTFCRRDGRRRNSDEKDTNAKDATCQRCKILCILNFKVYSLSWECNIRRNFLIADGHSWTKGQQSRPLLRNYNPPHNILIHAFLNAFLSEWGQCSTSTKIKIQRYLVKKLVMPFIFFWSNKSWTGLKFTKVFLCNMYILHCTICMGMGENGYLVIAKETVVLIVLILHNWRSATPVCMWVGEMGIQSNFFPETYTKRRGHFKNAQTRDATTFQRHPAQLCIIGTKHWLNEATFLGGSSSGNPLLWRDFYCRLDFLRIL